MNAAESTDAGGTLEIDGVVYTMTRLDIDDIGKAQAWLKERLPNPFVTAKAGMDIFRPSPPPPAPNAPRQPKPLDQMDVIERQAWEKQVEWFQKAQGEQKRAEQKYAAEMADYEKIRDRLLLAAKEDFDNPSGFDRKAGIALLQSPDGVAYMIWLSARHAHPDTTYEKIKAGVGKMDLQGLMKRMDAINQFPEEILAEMARKNVGSDQPPKQ